MTAAIEQHRPGPGSRLAVRTAGRLPVLDTARLQLRAPRIYDFDAYAEILCSDRSEFLGGPFSRSDAWTSFAQSIALWLLHGHGLWTIDAETRPSAGFVVLGFAFNDPQPELRVFLTKAAEGHGYAFEAAHAARTHAFGELGWDSVMSHVATGNDRARKLMRTLGAKRDRAAQDAMDNADICIYRHRPKVPE